MSLQPCERWCCGLDRDREQRDEGLLAPLYLNRGLVVSWTCLLPSYILFGGKASHLYPQLAGFNHYEAHLCDARTHVEEKHIGCWVDPVALTGGLTWRAELGYGHS